MVFINNIEDDRIKYYRSLRFTPPLHTNDSVFIAESEKVIIQLLKSNIEVLSLFLTLEHYNKHKELISTKNIDESMIFIADKEIMENIVGFNIHCGMMAMGKQPRLANLNELTFPLVILNNIINSENIGSIIRNCAGFNIHSIIYDNKTANPYLRRSVKVSVGNIFNMKIYKSDNLSDTIEFLKSHKIEVIAAEITSISNSILEHNFHKNSAIVFGSEGNGIETNILNQCSKVLHIPINPAISSLNVSVSSAIFLFELSKCISNL